MNSAVKTQAHAIHDETHFGGCCDTTDF